MKKRPIYMLLLILMIFWLSSAKEIRAYGDSAKDYFNLGLNSSMAYKKIEYFSKALELNPRFAPAYEKRGLHYFFQEKYDKVIEDLTRYIRLVPDKADAYLMLGLAYLKIGSYNNAIIQFDRAVTIDPVMTGAFGYRAEALRLNGRLEDALEDATRAIRMNGDARTLSDAYKTRGKVYYKMGQDELGSADFQKSVELDPRLFLYRYISGYASLDALRNAGLLGMIGIAFVLVFGIKLKPPSKDDER